MRSLLAIAVVATLLFASTASAQCASAGTSCYRAGELISGDGVCDMAFWKAQLNTATGAGRKSTLQWFQACTSEGATNGNGNNCCPDPCMAHTGTDGCTADRNCAALPLHSDGSSAAPSVCIRKDKLCGLLTVGENSANPADNWKTNPCGLYSFCYNAAGTCAYVNPSSGVAGVATLAPGDDVTSKCGALHPMVIAMLALMFVTLVGGIILVGVVVIINQRKADSEEQNNGGKPTHM